MNNSTVSPPPRGRGAKSNASGRFEAFYREAVDDGWSEADPAAPRLETHLAPLRQKTLITYNRSPDLPFDRTINPYKGCEHGCVYCYARPGHAFLGLSPGLDFESRLFFKPGGAALLERELAHPRYAPATIVLGGDTDVYQPVERKLGATRAILEVLARFRHPVALVTKSALVLRDRDILAPMAAQGIAKVAVSVTTLDRRLARAMEPRAAAPERRLDAIAGLAAAGVPVAAMVAPIIPGLNDHEIEAILARAKAAGASAASYVLLRLPLEIETLFQEWLEAERPDAAKKIMSLVRQTRGGRAYDPAWFTRGVGVGPIADLIAARFAAAIRRLGLNQPRLPMRTDLFRRPLAQGGQLALFGEDP